MSTYDITILTAEQYLAPTEPDWYVQQILLEDRMLQEALVRLGLRVHRQDWTSRSFDWSETTAVIFRSTWDYTSRYPEFLDFINAASRLTRLINPPETILWNLDKHYLRDLHHRGINIPETMYIEQGNTLRLPELLSRSGFSDAILKPAMSAGARHTYRVSPQNAEELNTLFETLTAGEAMMLQPFLPSVLTDGEVTLVMIGGKYSHAIRKTAKPGDFRVQDDFGGTVHPYSPTAEEIAFAERTVSVCDPVPIYARVDILRDLKGLPAVSELEAIEPELWFRFHPPAADRLAEAISQVLPSIP
jgi:glutathione synthase/RimK-type ligase-like ATP-grasp enzyme